MNATAWKRLFIPPLLALRLAPPSHGAAEHALYVTLLPGGEADLPARHRELERLSAGRRSPAVAPSAPGGGVSLPGLSRLETPEFLAATDPFVLEPLTGAERVLLLGPDRKSVV